MAGWEWTLVGRMALAAVLGSAIGFERELRRKSAGERTFALIALGTAAMVAYAGHLSADAASRVVQGIAAGIGFVGAGLIFQRSGRAVKGLTTAAAVWAVAAISVLCGAGAYVASVLSTVVVIVILELDRIPGLRRVAATRFLDGDRPPGQD